MKEKLHELLENSHTPYYHYPVASVIIMKDGREFYGVNVETSSPASGICAERNALFQALANGYKKEDFQRIYLYNQSENNITPCFICRQAMLEYCNQDLEIISYTDTKEETFILKDLCLHPFSEEDLK